MSPLSPAAEAVWEAFNLEEAGIFVDYGDKLAAALRVLADQVVPEIVAEEWRWSPPQRAEILAIAAELEGK